MRKTKLRDLALTSVDFCKVGANQEAFIMLRKGIEEGGKSVETWKQFTEKAQKSMSESMKSIFDDETLENEKRYEMIDKSVGEFMVTLEELIKTALEKPASSLEKSYEETEKHDSQYSEPKLHPEVKKALDEVEATKAELEEIKKSLEIDSLKLFAKKFEILGKKPDDLAVKLYDMKKSGGTAYDDYVTLLDEQLEMTEKSGIFKEFGSSRSGGNSEEKQLAQKIGELRKSDSSLTYEQAFVRVCDENPEIKRAME